MTINEFCTIRQEYNALPSLADVKTYRLFEDSGHAWLKVDAGTILGLGIANKISTSSYISDTGMFAYLEEDRDLGVFDKAAKIAKHNFKTTTTFTDNQSTIRSLRSYNPDLLKGIKMKKGAEVVHRGLLNMQVCVPETWTDEQVVEFAEEHSPCGIDLGWRIRRQKDYPLYGYTSEREPCASDNRKVHIILDA